MPDFETPKPVETGFMAFECGNYVTPFGAGHNYDNRITVPDALKVGDRVVTNTIMGTLSGHLWEMSSGRFAIGNPEGSVFPVEYDPKWGYWVNNGGFNMKGIQRLELEF